MESINTGPDSYGDKKENLRIKTNNSNKKTISTL